MMHQRPSSREPVVTETSLTLEEKQDILKALFSDARDRLSTYTGRDLEEVIPPDRRSYLFLGIYNDKEFERLPSILDEFLKAHDEKLTFIYERYEFDDRAEPLIYDPAALLLLERLDRCPYQLKAEWDALLPDVHFVKFALFWGVSVGLGGS